ncbi:hypothetical protein KBG23_02815 [Candidatus Dojkabacteria bacterium]|jgi:hypothetical protein|nr:hypothetical protein [Candidatus Dojkabacteria bacterium]
MEESRKMKILISVLFIVFLLGFSTVYLYLDRDSEEILGVKEDVVEEVVEVTAIPKIISVPPMFATVGELYEYFPKVMDNDTDIEYLTLELVSAPEWLTLGLDNVVRGYIPVDAVGETVNFVLRVSDGYNSSSQDNYILIVDKDED